MQLITSQELMGSVKEFYCKRPVLVVGAGGFLGQTIARRLTELGAETTVLSRTLPIPVDRPSGRWLTADIADPAWAQKAVRDQSIVFDMIGTTSAVDSNRDPFASLKQECLPHLSLVTACAEQATPPLVVFPSSRLVYGKPRYLPVDEGHTTSPLNVYGVHKLTVEGYLSVFQRSRGLPYIVFRISNPYGPHQGRRNKGYGIINQFIQQAANGETIRIFGDGCQLRDYVFADDLVNTILAATANPACYNQVFNLGGLESISVRDFAELIVRVAGGSRLEFVPWPPEHLAIETGSYFGSMAKLASLIDLPLSTTLSDGVALSLSAYGQSGH